MCEQEKINFMYETIPLRQLDGGIRVPMLKCTIFIKTKIKSIQLQAEKEDLERKKEALLLEVLMLTTKRQLFTQGKRKVLANLQSGLSLKLGLAQDTFNLHS